MRWSSLGEKRPRKAECCSFALLGLEILDVAACYASTRESFTRDPRMALVDASVPATLPVHLYVERLVGILGDDADRFPPYALWDKASYASVSRLAPLAKVKGPSSATPGERPHRLR